MTDRSPQESIFEGIGRFSAATSWTAEVSQVEAVRPALAAWLEELERDGRVQAVIGVRGEWLGATPLPVLPRESAERKFPSTQADVFLQLACDDREGLLWALRRCDARFAALLRCREELLGGRIGPGREAFGFLDPLDAPDREQIQREAVITSGPLAGASWLLYLRLQQDLARFAVLREHERLAVIGQGREGEQLPEAPVDAHVRRMREAGFSENRALIRRGFPFRQEREEGLAFVALAAHPESHARALDAMLGVGFPGAERLLAYAHPVSGGLYVVPPREWFTPSSK